MLETIYQEFADADMTGTTRIVQIRVTDDALRYSPVTVPLTPERARQFAPMREYCGGGTDVDLAAIEALHEILLHPLDWADLLKDGTAVEIAGEIDMVCGVRVVR